jgi:hypothetical protein
MSHYQDALYQSLIGIRTALSMLLYVPENAGIMRNGTFSHDAGGVMDHMASLIDALAPEHEALAEPSWPKPQPPIRLDRAKCPHCGGSMLGDGYTTVMHCERVDISSVCAEPDSAHIFCDPNTPND